MNMSTSSPLHVVSETLFIPLCMRSFETARPEGIIRDPESVRILKELSFDCRQFEGLDSVQLGTAIRTEIFDRETAKFLRQHPNAIVVNLGAGLCTRFGRMDNGQVHWIELDLEPVGELWHRVFQENERHFFVTSSVMDFSWLKRVQTIVMGRPVLFIAEGLLMYFDEQGVRALMLALRQAFPGAELLAEALSELMARNSRRHPAVAKTRASFQWGIRTFRDMEKWDAGIEVVDEWYYLDYHRERWGWMRLLKAISALHQQMKIGHLKFR